MKNKVKRRIDIANIDFCERYETCPFARDPNIQDAEETRMQTGIKFK